MVRIAAAIVCDFAQVREGLLTVVSGGITRLYREKLPSPAGIWLALMIDFPPTERAFPHEVRIHVTAPSGAELAKVGGAIQVDRNAALIAFDSDERAFVPMPIPLQMQIAEYGWHDIAVTVDSGEPLTVRVKVVEQRGRPPQTQAPRNRAARRQRPN